MSTPPVSFPIYRTQTGIEYPITVQGVVIPWVIISSPSEWGKKKQDWLRKFLELHLWDDFSGNISIGYTPPNSRNETTGLICYAQPNGTAWFDIHVKPTKTIH